MKKKKSEIKLQLLYHFTEFFIPSFFRPYVQHMHAIKVEKWTKKALFCGWEFMTVPISSGLTNKMEISTRPENWNKFAD